MEAYANLECWKQLALGTVVSAIYLVSFRVFGGTKKEDYFLEAPLYTWWVGTSFQVVIFPVLAYFAYKEIGGSISPNAAFVQNITTPWPEGKREEVWPMVRLWHCAFFGYMVKDMVGIFKLKTVYVIHHIVCIFLVTSFMFHDLPPSYMVWGGTVAEIGSVANNAYALGWSRGSQFLRYLIGLVMTFTNIFTIWLLVPFNRSAPPASYLSISYALTVVVVFLCVERERQALISLSAREELVPSSKDKPGVYKKGKEVDIPMLYTVATSVICIAAVRHLATNSA